MTFKIHQTRHTGEKYIKNLTASLQKMGFKGERLQAEIKKRLSYQ